MKLADILPTPEEFYRLAHSSNGLTESETAEIVQWTKQYFLPVFTRCLRECGPYSSDPELELQMSLATVSTIEHVLRAMEKNPKPIQ